VSPNGFIGPSPVTVSNDVTYFIRVANIGLGTVTGVTISNWLPSTVSFTSLAASQGTVTNSGQLITGNIGTLAPGAAALVTVDVFPTATGSVTDTVNVACNQFEPDLSNNTATDIENVVAPVVITDQPVSQIATNGGSVSFSAGVAGSPPLAYQWYDNGNPIYGATNSTLTLSNLTPCDAGSYSVSVLQYFAPEDNFAAASQAATLILTPDGACTNGCIQFVSVSNIVVYSCGSNCVPVYYSVTATDLCCTNVNLPVTLTFDPMNGSYFCPGTTNQVTCTATSASGYCNTTNFTVTVNQALSCVAGETWIVQTNDQNVGWQVLASRPDLHLDRLRDELDGAK
jgi:uncharacterized repeat protein (TIGR01451 family)